MPFLFAIQLINNEKKFKNYFLSNFMIKINKLFSTNKFNIFHKIWFKSLATFITMI